MTEATAQNIANEIDLTGMIIDYEQGELDTYGIVNLFSALVKNGMAWTLQGHYGRTAIGMIERGIMDSMGTVNWDAVDEIAGE